ncbi:MAG: Uma2 family endonuclease [Anaerolineae bacterium]|nr:Uma2 family endonuclease [Anaerolineae bacterium]
MALRKTFITPEEYLKAERASETKHEYYDGEIFAMAGASENHILIVGNTFASLHSQLRKRPCKAYANDMRTRSVGKKFYAYPDIVIVCGTPQFEDKELDTLLNPTVIIEVLSPSTEKYDRGEKFWQYRKLDSLQEYVLISQDKTHIEYYVRRAGGWVLHDVIGLEAQFTLESIDCTLTLADVYEKVIFDAEEGSTP